MTRRKMLDLIAKSKVLILGFGVEGQATLRYLQEKFPEKGFGVADRAQVESLKLKVESKEQNPPSPPCQGGKGGKAHGSPCLPAGRRLTAQGIKFHCGSDYLKNLNQYNLIIKSPGIKSNLPELVKFKKNGGKITSATNMFMSVVQGIVIGVTGSKGKSTTASLLYAVLKEAGKKVFLIGNIGNPALDELKNDSPETFYVYEMSSYQLEDLVIKPPYAIITNLFPEHLDYHGGVKTYYEAKMGIAENRQVESLKLKVESKEQNHPSPPCQGGKGEKAHGSPCLPAGRRLTAQGLGNTVFYNAGCDELNKRIKTKNCRKMPFNDGKNSKIEENYLVYQGEKIVAVKDIKLLGRHNLENILGVIAVSWELGVGSEEIGRAIKKFQGLEHRLDYVGNFQGIDFYNDSISTTPESTIQAIYALGKNLETIILGGLDRGYDFSELAEVILKSQIKNMILFPDTGEKIEKAISCKLQAVSNKIMNCQAEQNPPTPLVKGGLERNANGGFKKAHGSKLIAHSLNFFPVSEMQKCVKIAFEVTQKDKICLLSPASPSYNLFKNFQERGNLYKQFIIKLTKDKKCFKLK